MTIETIINKINKDTLENIKKILKASEAETRKILKKAKKELERELELERKKAERNITITRNIHLSNARRIARRSILVKKEELIEECFSEASRKLRELSSEEYRKTIQNLIEDGMKLIGDEAVVIPTKEEDLAIIRTFGKLTLSDERTGALGGVILKSKDGKVIVNNTFDALLERYKDDIRTEVASILFSEE